MIVATAPLGASSSERWRLHVFHPRPALFTIVLDSVTTANTISLDRLIKIAVITAIAFVVGFLGMWVFNGIAMGIGAAGGGHPSGRGNMSSQLVAGGIVAALGALVAAWWTRHDKD